MDLTLNEGEIYALLGPNGAGKTTLVRAISGRLNLEGGAVRVAGGDPRKASEARKRLGLAPQEIALYPQLTARENLEVFARLMGVPSSDLARKASEALEWIGLADRADDIVETLSGGMQRRLNIAAAVLHQPVLVVLDEPTVGVDISARETIHTMLRTLRRSGMAVLITTHDMDQAAELADRVGLLCEGALRLEGEPKALIAKAFGETKEVIAVFRAPPADAARGVCEEMGFAPSTDLKTWSAGSATGYETAGALSRRLAELGVVAEEVRVREPCLAGVYFRAIGREFNA